MDLIKQIWNWRDAWIILVPTAVFISIPVMRALLIFIFRKHYYNAGYKDGLDCHMVSDHLNVSYYKKGREVGLKERKLLRLLQNEREKSQAEKGSAGVKTTGNFSKMFPGGSRKHGNSTYSKFLRGRP